MDINISNIIKAFRDVQNDIHRTPTLTSSSLNEIFDGDFYFKCENFQKAGSFKVRGVLNKVLHLANDIKRRGVVTVSAGNLAQALAWASARIGVDCKVVMPENTPKVKVEAATGYGAEVILHGNVKEAFMEADRIATDEGRAYIHPFNDPYIICGHGGIVLEIIEQVPEVEAIVVGIGGGALAAGIALATKSININIQVFGVEPVGACAMLKSFEKGAPVTLQEVNTIAEGLAPPMAGALPFEILSKNVDAIVTVEDDEIKAAMYYLMTRMKLFVEPSGAAAFAAVMANKIDLNNKKTVIILSGGNADLERYAQLVREGSAIVNEQ